MTDTITAAMGEADTPGTVIEITPEHLADRLLSELDLGPGIEPTWTALAEAIRSGWLDGEDLHRLVAAAASADQRDTATGEIPQAV